MEITMKKIILSTEEATNIYIDEFYNKEILQETITRQKFEDLCQDLFNELFNPLDKVINDSGKTISEINEIIFVGGSTKIPKIKELIHKKTEFENSSKSEIFRIL